MKKIIVLIFIGSLLFAIKPVPKDEKAADKENSKIKAETVIKEQIKKQGVYKIEKDSRKDIFEDADSNSINDQREDDFQKIKRLKTRREKSFNIFKKEKPKKPIKSRDKSK